MSRASPPCVHPRLAEREHDLIQEKLRAVMAAHGLDALILARCENVLYATGYQPVVAYGSGVPAGVSLAVLSPDGSCHLILSSLESHAARALLPISVQVTDYPSWVFIDDGTAESRREGTAHILPFAAADTAMEIIRSTRPDAVIGIEAGSIVAPMWEHLSRNAGEAVLRDAAPAVMQSRMIKTPWEIGMLRHAAQFTERVMHRLAAEIEPGMYPADIENRMIALGRSTDTERMISSQMFVYAFGPYYSLSGTPRHYRLQQGDIVKLDGGFNQFGYASDIARSVAVGGAGDRAKRVFDTLYAGFEHGIGLIGPGLRFCNLYSEVRAKVESTGVIPFYGRGHVGHSIGLSPILEEWPQIAPDCTLEMQPGMVISFELSYFGTGAAPAVGGFNTEDTFLITETGHERFTHAPASLDHRKTP